MEGPSLESLMTRYRHRHQLVIHCTKITVRKTHDAKMICHLTQHAQSGVTTCHDLFKLGAVRGNLRPIWVLRKSLPHTDDYMGEHGGQSLDLARWVLMRLHQYIRPSGQSLLELIPRQTAYPIRITSLSCLSVEQPQCIEDPCGSSAAHVGTGSNHQAWLAWIAKPCIWIPARLLNFIKMTLLALSIVAERGSALTWTIKRSRECWVCAARDLHCRGSSEDSAA
mmetsp:Transcript_127034/g.219089  ORF Transcript_127034/g.219089 Transcript_127034/m.219089 type:complete len:224 (+) Transcript_127034:181-852(+)